MNYPLLKLSVDSVAAENKMVEQYLKRIMERDSMKYNIYYMYDNIFFRIGQMRISRGIPKTSMG